MRSLDFAREVLTRTTTSDENRSEIRLVNDSPSPYAPTRAHLMNRALPRRLAAVQDDPHRTPHDASPLLALGSVGRLISTDLSNWSVSVCV